MSTPIYISDLHLEFAGDGWEAGAGADRLQS